MLKINFREIGEGYMDWIHLAQPITVAARCMA
jgi:hypothetical protein